jgi:hypothetical protein
LSKNATEEVISEKLRLAIENPVRALFMSLKMNYWLLRIIKGILEILESSAIQ